ncbi:MAG: hypothetical protein LBD23_06240 [Oscillospiraceae bacterium]|jgi:hypothetical protein|nr:hypothetical protein [Oscillospiraceae bacterium]
MMFELFIEVFTRSLYPGIIIIVISILSSLWQLYRKKNTKEMFALVLSCDSSMVPSDTGGSYYITVKYTIDGKEYINGCSSQIRHFANTMALIYCSKNFFTKEYTKITVYDSLAAHLCINIILLILGLWFICYTLFIK